jgi:hypothetical protein
VRSAASALQRWALASRRLEGLHCRLAVRQALGRAVSVPVSWTPEVVRRPRSQAVA